MPEDLSPFFLISYLKIDFCSFLTTNDKTNWGREYINFKLQMYKTEHINLTSWEFYLSYCIVYFYFLKDFIYLFLERGWEDNREGEKHQCVVTSHAPPTGDLVCNPGMCPDLNWTSDRLVCRLALNPLSHTSQGCTDRVFKKEQEGCPGLRKNQQTAMRNN